MDIVTDNIASYLQGAKPVYRIKHNKNLSTKQKRAIRKTFNKIQSHITKTVNEQMLNVIAYGNSSNV